VDIFRYYRGIFKTKWDKYVEIPKLISCKLESIGNPYEEGFGVSKIRSKSSTRNR